ncbi:MFS transporter [uncultured Tolumonas sp.]|uniref:MFS transporter n=1 Tax=uncultured Tolumonas sp. TaxID=263765 RepID=UPI00292CE6D2|nr:MFS transporter [uncultured Tolumonas sp.]
MNKFSAHQKVVLSIILASYFIIILDISVVITGLPKILAELHFSSTSLSWIQSAYTLTFGGFLLLGARAGDILGRKKMYLTGLAIFIVTSLIISLAHTPEVMLSARAVQGIGAAILAPSTLALLSVNFSDSHDRSRAMAYYSSVAGIGATVGLVAGGIFADLLSWRIGFLINVPLGLLLFFAAVKHLKESEKHSGQFDLAGAVASTLGMSALVFGIVNSATDGWLAPVTLISLLSGVILLVIFLLNERNAAQPIMPLRLLNHRIRAGAYITRIFYLGGMVGFFFFITQYLQLVKGFTPFAAGVAFMPMTLVNFIAAIRAQAFSRKWGDAQLLGSGLLITFVGMFCLTFITPDTNYIIGIAFPMVLLGIGQGLAFAPMTGFGVHEIEARDTGAASGLVNVSHQMGSSLGLGILVVVFETTVQSNSNSVEVLSQRIANTMTMSALMIFFALMTVILLIVRRRRQPDIINEISV